jgi:hypothetical protein
MKLYWTVVFPLVCMMTWTAGAAQKSSPSSRFSITTRLDKTAVWVGDTLTYTVRIIHDRNIEIVLDNLKKEDLALGSFVVRDLRVRQGDWQGNKRLVELSLVLNSYETGKSELIIPSFNLYYFRRDAGPAKKDASADAVQVPATKVAARSTLTPGRLELRDFKSIPPRDLSWGFGTLALGVLGLAFLSIRGVTSVWSRLHRTQPHVRRPGRLTRDRLLRDRLARIRIIGKESTDDPCRFYAEVSQFLRQYLGERLGIEALGLTSDEIEERLKNTKTKASLAQEIKTVLEQCDMARYGKGSDRFDPDSREQLFAALEKIVRSGQSRRISYGL